MSKKTESELEGLSFEQACQELEEIVASLESNQQPLEESMHLYERGQRLSQYCSTLLEKAELKIEQLAKANPVAAEKDL